VIVDATSNALDLKQVDQEISTYVRPATFPIAFSLVPAGVAPPERARIPSRDLGHRITLCQGWNMSRRYGWVIACGREDMACPIGALSAGFEKPNAYYLEGNLAEGMYTATREAGARSEAELDRLPHGAFGYVVTAPLGRASLPADLILIYGSPAQVMRLVVAALWKRGGKLTSSFEGRADCADIIATTLRTGECQVILPCNGDRIFGLTQDDEMAFSIPAARVAEVMEGLRESHKGGIRYPIPTYAQFEPKMPAKYRDLRRMFDDEA
jgi:uncharacterized protein (DUF169 family)